MQVWQLACYMQACYPLGPVLGRLQSCPLGCDLPVVQVRRHVGQCLRYSSTAVCTGTKYNGARCTGQQECAVCSSGHRAAFTGESCCLLLCIDAISCDGTPNQKRSHTLHVMHARAQHITSEGGVELDSCVPRIRAQTIEKSAQHADTMTARSPHTHMTYRHTCVAGSLRLVAY